MRSTSLSLRAVVLDCPEPSTLASFYARLLGGELEDSDPEWCEVRVRDLPFTLAFQRATSYISPAWPDGEPQQSHLDMTVVDLEEAGRRATELGAVVLSNRVEESSSAFVVYADPAGHPFCLCEDSATV
jgi:predicted enzyme related to lactoylglutathione lyase